MALKDSWNDKVNGKDIVDAEDINSIARAVIELEENGGDQGVDGVTLDQIIDPDNNPIEVLEDETINIPMELGALSRETGETVERDDAIRCSEYLPISSGRIVYFDSNISTSESSLRVCCYDVNKNFVKVIYVALKEEIKISPNWAYMRFYRSDISDPTIQASMVIKGETIKAEFKKVYFADHGYEIYGANIGGGGDYHKLVIQADENEQDDAEPDVHTILELAAPKNNPKEATLALMNAGDGVEQFVDFSSMVYDPDNPTVEIVCQTRGNQPLPEFSVRYNDGNGAGRVKKLVVMPDCIPIKLTNAGIEVRRNNNYNNNATAEELVTVNLADLYDKVNVIYDALIANGTITE